MEQFLVLGCLIAGLLIFRSCRRWMQVKPAIRRFLDKESLTILKIDQIAVFRGCGSVRKAFVTSLGTCDYQVKCRALDGSERSLHLVAGFHPVTGTLYRVGWPEDAREIDEGL